MISRIKNIYKKSDFEYTVIVNTLEVTRLNRTNRVIKAIIQIQKTERTSTNPYGLEVVRYDEKVVE
jgi:hypothetical protein